MKNENKPLLIEDIRKMVNELEAQRPKDFIVSPYLKGTQKLLKQGNKVYIPPDLSFEKEYTIIEIPELKPVPFNPYLSYFIEENNSK